jgi:two-component system, cell cycle response regulator
MPRDVSHPGGANAVVEQERVRTEPAVRSSAAAVARSLDRSERGADRITLIDGLSKPPESRHDAPRAGVLLRTDRRGCGQLIALRGEQLRLGRSWEAAGRIDDDSVSRVHAEISCDSGNYSIVDLGSANGTFVDGERITRAELRDGSLVRLGSRVAFRFSLVEEDEQRALSSLQDLGHYDPLTGVFNRRHLERHLAAELAFAERHGSSISVILFDLDRFKQINDEHGHPAGDVVLERVAELMGGQIRVEDMLARYGGEEFMLVLRETPIGGAEVLAERIRRVIAEARVQIGSGDLIGVTVSAGCASLACTAGAEALQLIQIADRRLYLAKQQGRNQVVGSGPRLRSIPPPAAQPALDEEPPSRVHRVDSVARAFEQLPEELRLVLGLRYQEDCSFAEIAAILDRSEEHVQAQCEQGRALLRQSAA